MYSNEVDFVELYEMVGKYHPEAAEAQKPNFPPTVHESAEAPAETPLNQSVQSRLERRKSISLRIL